VAQIAQLHGARIACGAGPDGRGLCIEIMFPPPQQQ